MNIYNFQNLLNIDAMCDYFFRILFLYPAIGIAVATVIWRFF